MKRLFNLDYLRGLSAFSIMLYHYLSWSIGEFSSNSFFGRIGLYGVSIFYILSGLTLYLVYQEKLNFDRNILFDFFKKRVFRIFPLLWLITIVAFILNPQIGFEKLMLNLSGLFAFIKWDAYIATGAWSIGNEIVFYVFFPFFIIFSKNNKYVFILLCMILFIIYIYFTFYLLKQDTYLVDQWKIYINPLNQIIFFLGGGVIGFIFKEKNISNSILLIILFLCLLTFFFYPVIGDVINLVTGYNRIVFSILSLLICFSFFKISFKLTKIVHTPLVMLGEASYSIYLIHPLVYPKVLIIMERLGDFFHITFPVYFILLVAIISTLIVSYFTYIYFEKFFINLSKKSVY